jgi:hypothetical protein
MAKLPFDKLRWRMNIADMAQKFLALSMMTRWFRSARFDVLEDRRSADILELPRCHGNRLLGSRQSPTNPPTSLTPRITGDFISLFHGAPPAQLLVSPLIYGEELQNPPRFFENWTCAFKHLQFTHRTGSAE